MNSMRPSEQAALSKIQQEERFDRGTKTAINLGVGLTGLGLSSKIMPLLSKYIPADLAMKGINKISPKIGRFLQKGASLGLNVEEGLDFLKNQFDQSKNTKENRSIIEQYSPELSQFMSQEIKNGRTPIQAAAIAQNERKFSDVIKKMSKDHKTNWSSIVESVFRMAGSGNNQEQSQSPLNNPLQGNKDSKARDKKNL